MTTQGAESIQFKTETLEFIQEWKEKSGNLIMILHKVQEDFGYIPKPAAIKLSEILGVPLAKIYGVITFYHYFKLEKPGKHKISVCTGTACYLKGSDDILMELEQILGIGVNATTADGEFSIEAVRCVGCCGLAPVVTVGKEVFGKVTKDKVPEIVAKFKGKD
jgi:NADH-quinone oxidoreductase subunit E